MTPLKSQPNYKLLLLFLCELGNVGDKLGRGQWSAIGQIMDEAATLPGIDWKLLPSEAKAANAEETDSVIRDKLDLVDDGLEEKIESVLEVAAVLADAGEALYALLKTR